MKKVALILICLSSLIPLFSSEKITPKKQEVQSFIMPTVQTGGTGSLLNLYKSDGQTVKAKEKKSLAINYEKFTPFKKFFLIGAIVCTSIGGTFLIMGIISGAVAGYYFSLGHYRDSSTELVKLWGAGIVTGVSWGFLLAVFVPLIAFLWIAYFFALKGEKGQTALLPKHKRVSFNPFDLSVTVKL